MALDRSNFNLFGLDLYRLYEQGRQGFADIARWPLFQRLLPAEPVQVHEPGGGVSAMLPNGQAVGRDPLATGRETGVLSAVLLPADDVLTASLRLPASAAPDECGQAVALAVQAASPFPAEDTAWGYRAESESGSTVVHYVIAARSHIARYLAEHDFPDGAEVWAWADGAPVVLPGHGEHLRQRLRRRQVLQAGALAALVLALLVVLAAVPVLQRRQQAFDAQNEYHALAGRTAPTAAAREALGNANLRLAALREHVSALPDPSWLLARLTELLPDSVHLTQIDIKGDEVVIRGTADNGGALIELLGTDPGIREVRSVSAIVRNQVSGRETFVIQFHYRVPEPAQSAGQAQEPAQ